MGVSVWVSGLTYVIRCMYVLTGECSRVVGLNLGVGMNGIRCRFRFGYALWCRCSCRVGCVLGVGMRYGVGVVEWWVTF